MAEQDGSQPGGDAGTAEPPRIWTPGLYLDIPEDDYHAATGVSVSALKRFQEAPAKVRVRRPDTPSLAFGSLAHTAVLQPHLLADRYHVVDLDRISLREKATKDAMAAAGGRELVKRSDWNDALRLRDQVHAHPILRDMLAPDGLVVEASFFWIDRTTGLLCRGRADGLREDWEVVIDLKSTVDASPEGFAKSVGNYNYHWQQAHYENGLTAAWKRPRAFFFVAIESEEPFLPAIYELDPRAVELGRREVAEHLEAWAECERTGIWPGYPEQPQRLDLPGWVYARAGERA